MVVIEKLIVITHFTVLICPNAAWIFLSNFVRTGYIFFTIWPPTLPAS